MRIPRIKGTIDRRILINYQVDEDVLTKFLPKPFRPQLINGKGMAGICLIRLKYIRPIGLPKMIGISSENAAHRIAVEWMEDGIKKEGVYIPRRDTSSKLNSLAGSRVFPGVHNFALFTVSEADGNYSIQFKSEDGTRLSIQASETTAWNEASVFENLERASAFFKKGAVGYSPGRPHQTFDGLELKTYTWEVSPLTVTSVRSSFFENEDIFPKESVRFDNALLMRSIDHEWSSLKTIKQET